MDAEHFARVEEVFGRRVAESPEKVAVRDGTGASTYAELWAASARLQRALRDKGIRPGDAVGLHGVGDRETITAMLGVLRAGAHVVPTDPGYPVERVEHMLDLAGARVVLLTSEHPAPTGLTADAWHVRDLLAQAGDHPAPVEPVGTASDLAYVMFTSGSTGAPKAVGVPHGALSALCLRDGPVRRRPDEVFLVHTILTFDPSMLEIWSPLLVGAGVVCAPRSALSVHETAALLADDRVTTAVLTPAVFALVVERHPEALRSLRCLIVGGDAMPWTHAVTAREQCPDLEIINCYGPTENSIVSTAFVLTDWDRAGPTVPIGRPVAGSTCHVLDEDLRPVPPGEVGDLYVGGDRLAVGYLGDPALTAERFRGDPFRPAGRLYRTGDRARLLPDGNLAFEGREDQELKVRGFRVNLTEVEALTAADEQVREVVAVPVGAGLDRRVVAFVRAADPTADGRAIRARVATRAPGHLVPDEVVVVEAYPLTPSGKADRAALAAGRHDGRTASAAGPAVDGDDRTVLAAVWQERTGSPADAGHDFFGAGGSSLDLVRLIDDVGRRCGVLLDFEDAYGLESFDELVAMVRAGREAAS